MTPRDIDLELWKQWNKTKNNADLQPLINQLQPLISQQTSRWGATLSRPMLETKAKILAVEAIKSYNPNLNVALATHVTNRLQKLSRTVYMHTQAARLPEHKAIGMATFSVAQDQLKNDLGRTPTASELADHLGWSTGRTKEFQQAYDRKELLSSGEFNPSSFPVADQHDPLVDYVYFDMEPKKQKLFEHLTGYGGNKILSNAELMTKLDLSQGQLSYQKRQMTDMFHNALKQNITGTKNES